MAIAVAADSAVLLQFSCKGVACAPSRRPGGLHLGQRLTRLGDKAASMVDELLDLDVRLLGDITLVH
ncbi:MAG: hypothetical protein H6806_03545 [Planctomycetes bacterium]|nr:hypothetical protein [Planctomycetota bacterium]MCB9828828.1 hypothetical protein [Planctomycetota bacterium]